MSGQRLPGVGVRAHPACGAGRGRGRPASRRGSASNAGAGRIGDREQGTEGSACQRNGEQQQLKVPPRRRQRFCNHPTTRADTAGPNDPGWRPPPPTWTRHHVRSACRARPRGTPRSPRGSRRPRCTDSPTASLQRRRRPQRHPRPNAGASRPAGPGAGRAHGRQRTPRSCPQPRGDGNNGVRRPRAPAADSSF